MKKDLFIKILKYTGVALIGAFVGIGALAGVSSCYSHNNSNKTAKVTTTTLNKRYAKLPKANISNIIGSDHYYYAVAKNYATNGEGVFYQTSISLANSAIVSQTPLSLKMNATIIKNNSRFSTYFEVSTRLSGGVYHLGDVYHLYSSNQYVIYSAEQGIFQRNNCAFVFTNATFAYDSVNRDLNLLSDFFDIYDLSSYSEGYDFDQAFNYNNFYQVTETFYAQPYSPVVGVTTGDTQYVTTLDVGYFFSGGLVFNQIKVTFARNINNAYYFETAPNSNEYLQFPTNAVGAVYYYFLQMEYTNTATNFTLMACNRTSYTKNGTPYIQFLPAWASQDYKKLEFQTGIQSLKTRSIFNSLSDTNQLNEPIVTNNVGLSNVFGLMSMAFTAWLPIMNISIVPGITIGLLLFMPLVVGIIILVIWIVKR